MKSIFSTKQRRLLPTWCKSESVTLSSMNELVFNDTYMRGRVMKSGVANELQKGTGGIGRSTS